MLPLTDEGPGDNLAPAPQLERLELHYASMTPLRVEEHRTVTSDSEPQLTGDWMVTRTRGGHVNGQGKYGRPALAECILERAKRTRRVEPLYLEVRKCAGFNPHEWRAFDSVVTPHVVHF